MRTSVLTSLRAGSLVLMACQVAPAQAQSIDYDAFEQMFGGPVTSSATGKPQRVSDAPVNMEIVTADDIRRSGADTIPDVLRFVAGIDVRQYGQTDEAVGIRGYNTPLNPRVLVLLDGRQVYEDDYGYTIWPVIPVALSAIRQIEIIKGPNAALFGFNAVSGVINIVTYDPLRTTMNSASVKGGTQSKVYGEAVATAQRPGVYGVRLSAESVRADEFAASAAEPGSRPIGDPRAATVGIDARWQVAARTEWDAGASIASVDGAYYIDPGRYIPAANRLNSVYTRIVSDSRTGLVALDVYRNENRTVIEPAASYAQWRSDALVVKASDLLKVTSHHTLRLAVEYRDNALSSGQTFSGRIGYHILAGSVMWEWDLSPTLSLTSAIRLDGLSLHHDGAQFTVPGVGPLFRDHDIVETSFNTGLVYRLTQRDTLRLGAARAIQLPSLNDFGTASIQAEGRVIVGGQPLLSPSVVTNYEVDYDRVLSGLDATLRLAAFAQHSQNTIASPLGSGLSILPTGQVLLTAKNLGNSNESGGEITLKGASPIGIRWSLSYALAAVRDETPQAQLDAASGVNYQRMTPTNSVVGRLGYDWRGFEADVQARWQSHMQDYASVTGLTAEPVTVPNYVTVDARIGYRISRNVTVSVTGQQLGRHELTETAGLQVERRILAGLKVRF